MSSLSLHHEKKGRILLKAVPLVITEAIASFRDFICPLLANKKRTDAIPHSRERKEVEET